MGDVVRLRLPPLVRVGRWSAGWLVTVRPCPAGIASTRSFDSETAAAEYAASLKRQHGFRVRPDTYGAQLVDGARG